MPTPIPTYVDPNLIPSSGPPPNYYGGSVGSTGGNRPADNGGNFLGLPNLNPFYSGSNSGIGGIISNPATNPGAFLDPLGSSILGNLFGGDNNTFQPYIDDQGRYVFGDPNRINPVPVANVPGATLRPSPTYRRGAQNVQTIQDLLPFLSNAVNRTATPSALAQLNAQRATQPGYAELQANLFNTYGPVLNQIGNEILRQNALATAGRENEVLTGPGHDLVQNAYDLSQIYDKPYYDTRQATADQLAKLFSSVDLTGGLSDTERREIEQGQSRQGIQRGTLNAPSNTDVVANAMQYGAAGHARQSEAKSQLSDALSKAAAFLPTAKSGVDVFQTATGRSSTSNPGQSVFQGVNQNANNDSNYGLAGNLLGSSTQLMGNQMQIDANKKDWIDQFSQITSAIGNLTSSAKGVAGIL